MSSAPETITYRIDAHDVITAVGKGWSEFAVRNGWEEGGRPEQVVGRSIWDFTRGPETQYLYALIFQRVRAGRRIGPLRMRCDAPALRRLVDLRLSRLSGDGIGFRSTTIRTEAREAVPLLDRDVPRSDMLVRICSLCEKIEAASGTWVEVEAGLHALNLFHAVRMPLLSHGLCPACGRTFEAALGDGPRLIDLP